MNARARTSETARKEDERAIKRVPAYVPSEGRDAGVAPARQTERGAEVLPGGVGGPTPVLERATRYGDSIVFDGVFLIADEAFVYEQLDALTVERGETGVDNFVASFETQIGEEVRSAHAHESSADVSAGWSENIAVARARATEARSRSDVERSILPALQRVHARMKVENRKFLEDFESMGNDLVRRILARSDAALDEQLRLYGVQASSHQETYLDVGEKGWRKRERTVFDFAMTPTPAAASLGYATSELAAKRQEITTAEGKRVYETKRVRGREGVETYQVLRRDDALERDIAARQQEYSALQAKHTREHPILRFAGDTLVGLTARDNFPSPQAARAIFELVAERKENIREVRDEIGGRYSIWMQPLILAMTAQLAGVPPGTRQDRLVRDKFRTYKSPREQALHALAAIVMALGLAAAAFTLGGSTVIAGAIAGAIAAIDLGMLADAIAQYQVDVAASETDLDPAQSVSQTNPTAAEIVFDVIAVLGDVIALGAEIKAAGAAGRAASAAAHAPELLRFGAEEGAAAIRLTEKELAVLEKEGMTGFAGSEGRLARTTGPTYLVRIGKAGEGAGFSRWGFGIFKDEAAAEAYARWLSNQSEEVLRNWTAIPQIWPPVREASGNIKQFASAFETIKVWKLPEGGVAYVGGRVAPQLESAKVFADVSKAETGAAKLEVAVASRQAPVAGGGSQVLILGDVKPVQVGGELPVLAASGKPAIADPRAAVPLAKAALAETKSAATESKAAATEGKALAAEPKTVAEDVKTTAPRAKEPEFFTKAEEITVSREEFERALAHGYVPQAFDEVASVIHEIGERTAAVVAQNPQFVQAVADRNWKLAGTLFHAEAARQGPAVAAKLGSGFAMDFEVRLAGGESRLDILAVTPTGLIEVDWKTTGRSGLSWRVRTDEMPRHAAHVVQDLQVPLSQQLSKSWVDYLRPYMPGAKWPRG